MSASNATVTIYPSPIDNGNGDYLAVLQVQGDIPLPEVTAPVKYCDIVILDISGSMGQYVQRVCTKILPMVFRDRGFDDEHEINLILFESRTTVHKHKVKEFPTLPYVARGGTTMAPVYGELETLINAQLAASQNQEARPHFRILTISDGEVGDVDRSCEASSQLFAKIKDMNIKVDSCGVRLFTSSYGTPDARALSSILQFNTTTSVPALIDIPFSSVSHWDNYFEETAATIKHNYGAQGTKSYLSVSEIVPTFAASLIVLGSEKDTSSPTAIFKEHPWSKASSALPVSAKKTLFWINKAAFDALNLTSLTVSDVIDAPITIMQSTDLDNEAYESLIASRIDYYMMQMKLLRVVGTKGAVDTLKQMSAYFTQLEQQIYSTDSAMVQAVAADSAELTTLKARLAALYKSVRGANSRLGLKMAEIANMDATTKFNAAQAASFLRSTGSGAASKGLVRRAGTDLDFDSIVKQEVVEMAKNLSKLEEQITPEAEAKMKASFVSLATTFDGIRAVCQLATTTLQGEPIEIADIGHKESLLDTLSAFDILSYLNIVGVPVQSTVGDYPDPYRYNINVIFTGHYCSLSDLMTLHQAQETDNAIQPQLYIPGDKTESGRIDNVIPVIDNKHIYNFLMDYAQQTLSLYSSIGLRRVLAHIWETPHATLSAALVKMMRVVIVEPTQVNFDILRDIYEALKLYNRQSPNRKNFAELYYAAKYIKGFKPSDEPIQPTFQDDENLNYLSNTFPHIAHIQTPLTQLMFPLIQTSKWKNIRSQGDEVELDDNEFGALLRAVFYNEVYNSLRSDYRGKPNSEKLRLAQLHSLIGFDPEWKPQLTSTYETDPEFDPATAEEPSKYAFFKSKTFKSASNRIQRLNVLLTIPFFAKVFDAFDRPTEEEVTEAIDELKTEVPRVLATPETYLALKKKAQIDAMSRELAGTNNNDDYLTDYEDEYEEAGPTNERTAELTTKIAEYKEEKKGAYDEMRNVAETKWAEVYYNLPEYDEKTHSSATMQLMQLYAIIYAYSHPEPTDRYPCGIWQPTDFDISSGGNVKFSPRYCSAIDFPQSISFKSSDYIAFLVTQRNRLYKNVYDGAVNAKIKGATAQLVQDLAAAMISTDSIDTYTTLLSQGMTSNQYSASFKSYQDPQLAVLWSKIIDPKVECPLRTEKLRLLILGRKNDADKTPVWNNGFILLDHPLQKASQFFYDADIRGEWIQICEEFAAQRKTFEYRPTDLANRHSHHLSHKSYFGLGYDSLAAYKAAVSAEEYAKYCEEHKDCCGLTPVGQKRVKLSKKRHEGNPKAKAFVRK